MVKGIVAAALLGGSALYFTAEGAWVPAARAIGLADEVPELEIRFAEITRGDILSAVPATGTLQPVATVVVGTEVSGQVKEIYADHNQEVRRGDAIALIDPVTFQIAVEQAEADLDVARAAVESQRATVQRMQAALETARFEHSAALANAEAAEHLAEGAATEARRKRALGPAASGADRDQAISAEAATGAQSRSAAATAEARRTMVDLAAADLEAARSQFTNAEAVVRQSAAALRQAQIELERTVIRSPVDGVIIHRDIEVGQTVAASLQAPTLFTIAQNLRDMQVNASVDESEIGRIAPGQRVEFTVDAYRERRFEGSVHQIRKSPQTAQNVVTYTVVVKADNSDLLLLPGMTASARFVIAESRDISIAPNAALRFQPPEGEAPAGPHVWVEDAGGLRAVAVETGLVDEALSEIRGEGVHEGLRVAVGIERPKQDASTGRVLFGGI